MEKINFIEYNKLTQIDKTIKFAFETLGIEHAIIMFPTKEQQILYILNIKTIICMTKEYNLHYHIEDKELDNLYESIKHMDCKKFSFAQIIIQENIKVINRILRNYYLPRNYIYPRYCNELLVSETGKKILFENPFFINNHMEYFCNNRITKEEQIINTVIEYYLLAQKETKNKEFCDENLILIKKMLIQRIEIKELEKYILFMISNTYQEIMNNENDTYYNEIKHIVENNKINVFEIVKYFKTDDLFSNNILRKFINYNINIKQGRLEDLKTKESAQYTKKFSLY